MSIFFRGKVKIPHGATAYFAGACDKINVAGTYWDDTPITPYDLRDTTRDSNTFQALIPSWAYGGAYVKKIYSEVLPKNTTIADNKCFALFVKNDNSEAQWTAGILKRDSAASDIEGQGVFPQNAWSYGNLFFTPIHYANGIMKSLSDSIAPIGEWISLIPPATDNHIITSDQANKYLNGCLNDLSDWLAPGDGVYKSLSII